MNTHRTIIQLLVITVTIALMYAGVRADERPSQDQAAITRTAEAFVKAFEKGDSEALAAFWVADGDYVHISGRVIKGRQAIAQEFSELFAENKGLTVRIDVQSVRFPTPDTAIEDGVTAVMSREAGVLPSRARYTNFLVKQDGKWMLSSVREMPYEPPGNYTNLRPLEWLIGEWVEETSGPAAARAIYEWTPDRNFIIASRAVSVKDVLLDSGSIRLGWDPVQKLIRSWSFESDGGFGHASWRRDGNRWIVNTSSVLRNGSLMTSTTIVTRLDADTLTWQVVGQQLDGKPIADSTVVRMKRVK